MKRQLLASIILLTLILTSCAIQQKPNDKQPDNSKPTNSSDITTPDMPTEISGGEEDNLTVQDIISSMTLKEKVGQMFFIGSRTNKDGQRQLSMDESLQNTIENYKPGGFIFFAENIEDIQQTTSFIENLQDKSKIPMFIGIDEEGGIVTRLNKAEALGSTVMPEAFVIGKTNNAEYAYKASKAIAEEIKSLGFNVNFAPVADVFSNPQNKVIGSRAYSSNPEVASKMVAEAVKGAKDSGIIPVIKHFPGHGDTLQDSHTGIAVVENDIERLRKVEFLPFKAGIQAGAGMVMTAHVLTPYITENELPATLSKTILQDLLRKEIGFDGVIITDGLEMSAISSYYSEEEAVVMAVEAGVDILLLPKDFEKAYNAILSAVKDGRISEQRINDSVIRILKIKVDNIINGPVLNLDAQEVLGSEEHKRLVEKIREESIR